MRCERSASCQPTVEYQLTDCGKMSMRRLSSGVLFDLMMNIAKMRSFGGICKRFLSENRGAISHCVMLTTGQLQDGMMNAANAVWTRTSKFTRQM